MPEAILSTKAVSVTFGGIRAVSEVSIELYQGEILGLIGANGAGKTTFLNVLSGFQSPTAGVVTAFGREISNMGPETRPRHGIARTFQGARIFGNLSVRDNLVVAGIGAGLRRRDAAERARAVLTEMRIAELSEVRGRNLTAGRQRLVALARAVVANPRIVLLDEPAAGLNDTERAELVETVIALRDAKACSAILVEHSMPVVMSAADRIVVLERGKVLFTGTPDEVRESPDVRVAYLGNGAKGAGR